jgi:hypothetical protein
VTDVDVPSPAQFFNSVDVTLTGQNIGNAGVRIGQFNPAATAVELRESTDTRAVVRLTFNGPLAEASGTITLFDRACSSCSPFSGGGPRYDGIDVGGLNPVSISGPNAVSSITFPAGGGVQVGSVFQFRIKLARPAKRGIQNPLFPDRRPGAGETVHWQLVPSTMFETAPGSGIPFIPTGLNQVVIPGGDEFVNLTVRLAQLPGNCGSGCQGRVQTRMINLNTDQPPYFKEATFTMLPAAAQ